MVVVKKKNYCDKCHGTGELARKPPTKLADTIVGALYHQLYSWQKEIGGVSTVKPAPVLHKDKTQEIWEKLMLSTCAYRIRQYMMKEQWK
jgi:hypothetical protein